jgi:hypothetical protein
MNAEPETVNLDRVLNQQRNDLDKAIEVIEEHKEDLKEDWTKECFDVTVQALKERRAIR